MKKTAIFILASVLMVVSSCMKDGEMLTATLDGGASAVGTADNDIVLTQERASGLALTLYWDSLGDVSLSNPDAQAPDDMVINAVQFSPSDDFAEYQEMSVENGTFALQLTGAELNRILVALGYEGAVRAPLFIRMRCSLGTNMDSVYGSTLQIMVTPYLVDMSRLRIAGWDSSTGELTGEDAYIPASGEGTYKGFFIAPSGWYNCFFIEGDGTIWGTNTDGNPFPIEKKSNVWSWNIWFPEPAGCYYVSVSTSEAEWSALSLPEISVSAGVNTSVMQLSETAGAVRGVIDVQEGNVSLQVGAAGDVYDDRNGTDSPSDQQEISFVASADGSFALADGTVPSGITAPSSGTYTLFLYFGTMTWELVEGDVPFEGEPEPEEPSSVHLVGYDGFSLDDSHLMTYDPDTDTYYTEIQPQSWGEWGIQFVVDSDWAKSYAPDTENPGALVMSSSAAMPDVECVAGNTYRVTISLSEMTYSIEIVGEPVEPEEKDMIYAYWTWESGWVETAAAAYLLREGDTYSGYISAYGDNTGLNRRVMLFRNFVYTAGNASDIGAIGCSGGSSGSLGTADNLTYWPLWFEEGLTRLEVNSDMTECTSSVLVPCLSCSSGGWTLVPMVQNGTEWLADMSFSAGDTFKVVLSSDGSDWTWQYSGTDGVLHAAADGNDNIYVEEAGDYTVAVSFSDASAMTYSITRK